MCRQQRPNKFALAAQFDVAGKSNLNAITKFIFELDVADKYLVILHIAL